MVNIKNENTNKSIAIEFENVNDVPVAFCRPDEHKANNSIAIWLPYLGGSKETVKREIQMLAGYGYFAFSVDPWLHGERKGNIKEDKDIRSLVFKEFKVYMWQILGITTMDVYRVIDWAINRFNFNESVVAGGVSMGGDIAIALAGIDTRIKKVATVASSPDWNRHGMTDVMESRKIIEQGDSTAFGKWLYDKLNPKTNLKSFCRPLQMHIELGTSDTHIKSNWTVDFKKKLFKTYPDAECKIKILLNEGYDHLSLVQNESITNRALHFLL